MVGPPSDAYRQGAAFFFSGTTVQRENEYGMDFEGWAGLFDFDRGGGLHRIHLVSIQEKVRILLRRRYGYKGF